MWYVIIGLLISIYLIFYVYIPGGGLIETYVFRPSLWIILAISTYILAKNEGLEILKFKKVRKWFLGKNPIHAGLLLGGFQVALLIMVGIFFGFGNSPYSFTPQSIILNIVFLGSMIAGLEISRAYIIKKTSKNKKKFGTLMIGLITIFYVLILIRPGEFSVLDFSNPKVALEFLGLTIIAAVAINLLASYLSYLGGALAAIGYMGTLQAFEYFSPILPNADWTILAFIGTIAPTVGFLILQSSIETEPRKKKRKKMQRSSSDYGWTTVAIFTILIVFFSYGYLGVEPTVIYSGSMQPEYEVGDIVIVDNINIESIEEGDIIQFIRDNTTILHRVVEITEDEKGILFKTKGDANEDADTDLVQPKQIRGKAILKIPKVGWIQIFIKGLFRTLTTPFSLNG
jgi:signal peptidase